MRNKRLKIWIASLVIFLFIFCMWIVNSFVGNPISKFIAKKAIDEHIEQYYQNLELEVTAPFYSFKFGEYFSRATSTTSKDTHFTIYARGNEVYDNYESAVLDKWNTMIRLEEEFEAVIEPIIEKEFPYDCKMIVINLESTEADSDLLKLDMPFDMGSIPLGGRVTAYVYDSEQTWEEVLNLLKELAALMSRYQFPIRTYSLVLVSPEEAAKQESIGIYEFPKELIDEALLPEFLEKYYLDWEQQGQLEKSREYNN